MEELHSLAFHGVTGKGLRPVRHPALPGAARGGWRLLAPFPAPSTPPEIPTFPNVLAALPPESLATASGQGTGLPGSAPVAMDGKALCRASKQPEDGRRIRGAAVAKRNESPAVCALTGRTATTEVLPVQHETARGLLGRRAGSVLSAGTDNPETSLEDLKAIAFSTTA